MSLARYVNIWLTFDFVLVRDGLQGASGTNGIPVRCHLDDPRGMARLPLCLPPFFHVCSHSFAPLLRLFCSLVCPLVDNELERRLFVGSLHHRSCRGRPLVALAKVEVHLDRAIIARHYFLPYADCGLRQQAD